MENQQLRQRLAELQAELDNSSADDDETRQALSKLRLDIQDVLDRSDDELPQHHHSLRERLDEAALRFEASHPNLTLAIGELANGLAQMGL